MSTEPKTTAAPEKENAYEYAFEQVPMDKRKKPGSIFVILAGYAISLSNFVTGTTVGSKMAFGDAVLACLVGNLFLIVIAVLLGVIAFKTGLSTAFLSRKALGIRASAIFSVILVISSINWIAVNADTFANLIKNTFSWWPIPVAITCILVVIMWAQSAIRGMKGLEIVSWLGVPCAVALTVACVIAVGAKIGYGEVLSFVPDDGVTMTFTAASASFIGAWVFGCIITPDVCRFAKKETHVVVCGFFAFIAGLFGLELCGILVAAATRENNFVGATAALGLGVLVFFCAIFCLWTTQDNNIYGASLAMQNVFQGTKLEGKVSHKLLAIIVAALAAAFAAFGAVKFLLPVTKALSIFLPPIPGLIVAEWFFVKKSKELKSINWLAIVAWVGGAVAGSLALKANFFISPVIGMGVTIILYVILSKLLDKSVNKL
ncbi:MAG: cytosine permease [Pseudoflavonifractor sp.]